MLTFITQFQSGRAYFMTRSVIVWMLIAAGILLVLAGARPMLRDGAPDFILLMVGIYFIVRGALAARKKRT